MYRKIGLILVLILTGALVAALLAGCMTETVKVSFDTDGGSAIRPITITADMTRIPEPGTPTKEGHRFVGWYTDRTGGDVFDFTEIPATSVTAYAIWELDSVTVTFKAKLDSQPESEAIISTLNILYGSALTLPSVPEKEGYNGEWNTTGININNITRPITIKARYTLKTINITFVKNNGDENEVRSGTMNQSYDLPESPMRAGFVFAGWYTDLAQAISFNFDGKMPSAPVTVYARWISESQLNTYFNYVIEGADLRITGLTRTAAYLNEIFIPEKIRGYTVKYIGYDDREHPVFISDSLTRVHIPATTEYIGNSAFTRATKLRQIIFSGTSTLDKICDSAFRGCTLIESFTLPSSVTHIGAMAFAKAINGADMTLSAFNISASQSLLSFIGENAFAGCKSLINFTIPVSYRQYDYRAFLDTALTWFTVPSAHQDYLADDKGVLYSKNGEILVAFPHRASSASYIVRTTTKHIAPNAFYGNTLLRTVSLPMGLLSIGNSAFEKTAVTAIEFDSGSLLSSIGEKAFYQASAITSISLPSTVISIGEKAFASMASLVSVSLGTSLLNLGQAAFEGDTRLTDVVVPATLEVVPARAFAGCTQLSISFASGSILEEIGDYAFYGCIAIGSITLPTNLRIIGERAFASDENSMVKMQLFEVSFNGYALEEVGDYAFSECTALQRIELRAQTRYIGEGAFYNCVSLNMATFNSGIVNLTEIKPYTFYNCINLGDITLPSSIRKISDYAFFNCRKMTKIVAGSTASPSPIREIGNSAFENCIQLKYNESSPNQRVIFPQTEKIGDRAFYGCTALTQINIPASLEYVGQAAFAFATNLNTVSFGATTLTTLSKDMFMGCTALTSFTVPKSVTTFDGNPFTDCTRLTLITAEQGHETFAGKVIDGTQRMLVTMDETEIVLFPTGKTGSYTIPVSIMKVGDYAFYGTRLDAVIVPDYAGTFIIGDYSFANSLTLYTVQLAERVTEIGEGAFYADAKLTNLSILNENNELSIGDYAFAKTALKAITVPKGVVLIGDHAFDSIYTLASVSFADGTSPLEIGAYAFAGAAVTALSFPSRLTHIGEGAFSWNTGLASISWGAGEQPLVIDDYAFENCHSLVSLQLPERLVTLGRYAFASNLRLEEVYINGTDPVIGRRVFYLNSRLRQATISRNVNVIGDSMFQYNSLLSDVIIEPRENPLVIMDLAFQGCSSLTEFTVDAMISEISVDAFSFSALSVLNFEEGIDLSIGGDAFRETQLVSLVIPYRVKEIGGFAFAYNEKLTEIEFASGLEIEIGNYAFAGIGVSGGNNVDITIPAGISYIGEYAFADIPGLKSVVFQGGNDSQLTAIGEGAFENARGLTAVIIPPNVTSIGAKAFNNASNLSSVTITNTGGYTIGDFAFANCAMERMNLQNVEYIDGTPFYGSAKLAIVTVGESNAYYKSVDNVIYSKSNVTVNSITYGDGELLVSYPAGKTGAVYSILRNVKAISDYAFSGNKYLSSIILNSTAVDGIPSVVSINGNTFSGLGATLKFFVYNISAGAVDDDTVSSAYRSAPHWQEYADKIFNSAITEDDFTFELLTGDSLNCRIVSYVGITATTLRIPAVLGGWYVREIGANAFRNNNKLREVYLPSGLVGIGDYAFANCIALQKIEISASVNTIGSGAFSGCENLITVTFGENSTLTAINKHTFENCYSLSSITIPAQVESIGAFAFAGTQARPSALENIVFATGSKLKTVGNNAFQYCVNLNSITLPKRLERLNMHVFYGCVSLTSVVLDKFPDDPILNLENNKVFEETPQELIVYINRVLMPEYNKARYWKEIASQLSQKESILGSYSVEDTEETYTVIVIREYLGILDAVSGSYDKSRVAEYQSNIPEILADKPVVTFDTNAKTFTQKIAGENNTLDYYSFNIVAGGNQTVEITNNGTTRRHIVSTETITVTLRGVKILKYLGVQADLAIPGKINGKQVLALGGYSINSKVRSITLPFGLIHIEPYAFSYASSLERAVLPLTLRDIGEYAFSGTRLKALGFGDINNVLAGYSMLTDIKGFAFYNSMYFGETEFVIPPRVKTIGAYAFAGNSQKMDVKNFRFLGKAMTLIGNYAFSNSKIVSITLPGLLDTLGEGVFKGCSDLLTVFIPEAGAASNKIVALAQSSTETFGGCSFVKVYVPQERVSLYRNAIGWKNQGMDSRIYSASSLFTVDLGGGKVGTFAINVTNSDNKYASIVQYYGAAEVTVPERINDYTITEISSYAFNNTVTRVALPATVAIINSFAFYMSTVQEIYFDENAALTEIGASSFYGTSITEILIPYSVRYILQSAFENSKLEVLRFADPDRTPTDITKESLTISASVFTRAKLEEVYLPKRLISIGANAFSFNTSLEKLLFVSEDIWADLKANEYNTNEIQNASYLEIIDASAFYGCSALEEVYLPFNLKQIKETVFAYCTSLKKVIMLGGNYGSGVPAGFSLPTLSAGVFNNINNPFFKIFVPQNSWELYRAAEIWKNYAASNANDPDYIIPNLVQGDFAYRISQGAVVLTKYLGAEKNLVIPATMTIGGVTFNVKEIGTYFLNGTVETVTMAGASVQQSITKYAFAQSAKLTKVSLPASVTSLGDYVFYNCISLRSVVLPSEISQIPTHAFDGCGALESLAIPSTVANIGVYAFANCTSLYRIIIKTPESGNPFVIEPGSNMLQNTSPYLKIFVNISVLNSYKTKTGWSENASKILPDDCLYGEFTIDKSGNGDVTIYQYVGAGDIEISEYLKGGKVVKIEKYAVVPDIKVTLPAGSNVTYGPDLNGRVFYDD